jgi:hypothetical protein
MAFAAAMAATWSEEPMSAGRYAFRLLDAKRFMKAVIALGVPAEKLRFVLDSKTGKISIDMRDDAEPTDAANPWTEALAKLPQPTSPKPQRKQK